MKQDQHDAYENIMARLQAALVRWYKGNPLAYAELCADEVTFFSPATQGRLDGITALKASLAPFEGKTNVPRFETLNSTFQFYGDIGILAYNLNEYATGESPSYRWNATEVYRRIGNEWRIIHAHWSPIK